ncbi:hypothetical protein BD311DRAFT_329956 [Dichomitus squalens]|uniref:Uncharacterized protein n=1 Tax=Dichomitus squalens TaxID=114155 RepID=A0A4Q9MKV7_9APHY|nr:hypothetical protein BD311DRAFT_329956 [Dichomitus squalens]
MCRSRSWTRGRTQKQQCRERTWRRRSCTSLGVLVSVTVHCARACVADFRRKLFRTAINYIDEDSGSRTDVDDPAVCTYRLSRLDDKDSEYAELLAAGRHQAGRRVPQARTFQVRRCHWFAVRLRYRSGLPPGGCEHSQYGPCRHRSCRPSHGRPTPVLWIPHGDGYGAQYGVSALSPNSLNVNLCPRL